MLNTSVLLSFPQNSFIQNLFKGKERENSWLPSRSFSISETIPRCLCTNVSSPLKAHLESNYRQEKFSSPSELATIITAKNLQELEDLSSLPQNWDGYGAFAIDSTLYRKAKELIKKLPIKVYSIPTSSGSIQIEIHRKNSSLEIEVLPEKFSILFEKNEIYQETETSDFSEILKLIGELDAI